jgi:hypothetical protein
MIAVFSFPSCLGLLAYRNLGEFKASRSGFRLYLAAWSKVSLDMALVLGIAFSCLTLIGMIENFDPKTADAISSNVLAKSLMNALMFVVWGGVAAGIGYVFERKEDKVPIKLKPIDLLIMFAIISGSFSYVAIHTGESYGTFFHPVLFPTQTLIFALLSFISWAYGTSWQEATVRANITTVLVLMAFAIVSWFLNWSDFQNSTDSVYLIPNILYWGCSFHISLYLVVMASSHQPDSNLRIKAWHLTEAYAFYSFLVVAPVGVTEYLRETQDQQAIEEKLQAQQFEIDSLRTEIRELKRNN